MKQVPKTPALLKKLQAAVGDGVDVSSHPVYGAIALNTRPVRQQGFWLGARHTPKALRQMADMINVESKPLQVMHDSRSNLNVGRTFHAQVEKHGDEHQLRTLSFVSPQHPEISAKVDDGTVDQVSMSAAPKAAICSKCDFNHIGPEATEETYFGGMCPNGHKLVGRGGTGKNAAHLNIDDVASFYELSLVNSGGADGARILPSNAMKLALAEGGFASDFTIHAREVLDLAETPITEKTTMDAEKLFEKLELSMSEKLTLSLENKDLKAKVAELEGKVASAGASTELQAQLTAKTTEATDATAAATSMAKILLVMTGDAAADPKGTPAELLALVEAKKTELAAALTGAAALQAANAGKEGETVELTFNAKAFLPRR